MQTSQSRAHLPNLLPLSGSHSLGHDPSALIVPRPGTRQRDTAPVPQSPLKLFQLASPKSTFPALSVPSHRNCNKFSPLLLSLGQPPWLPACPNPWYGMLPPLGVREDTKLSSQSSLDLLTSPYLNNNKPIFWTPFVALSDIFVTSATI